MSETPEPYHTAQNGTTPAKPITRLCALDNLFEATGTAEVKVTRQGVESIITVPIQSVNIPI